MRNADTATGWLIMLCLAAVLVLAVVLMACGSDEPSDAPATERAISTTTADTPTAVPATESVTSTPRAEPTPTAVPATVRATSTPRAEPAPTAAPATERAASPPTAGNTPTATPTIAFGSTSVGTDREALTALYKTTDGDNWENNENWLSDAPLGQWSGVSTDDEGRVTHLSLIRNRLSGEIPPELGNLSSLRRLVLDDNKLRGEIPLWLGGLFSLTSLYLNGNELRGEIPPWLGGLFSLTSLYLNGNELIPSELGNLSSLEWLILADNQLSGEIPPELGGLSNLWRLSLRHNRLSGKIPPELGNLFSLQGLILADNQLSGEIPPELGDLSNLRELSLGFNRLSGEIPPELGNLSNLQTLSIGDNELSGEIPPELGNLFSLQGLWVDGNNLSGCVPRTLAGQYVKRYGQEGSLPFCTTQPSPTKHPPSNGEQGNRLQAVRDRGVLICAGRNDVPGFSYANSSGNNVGFDIDLCRAVAAAVLGDPNAIEIRVIHAAERGPTIQSGEVDMLVRTVTWTTSRDAHWGNYAHTMFYDGQGFMVNRSLEVSSALELQDATVCVTIGTWTELNLQDFSNRNNLSITPLTFEDTDDAFAAYKSGQCNAFTNDLSRLAALGAVFADRNAHVIMPDTISDEPLGPLVPHGDDQWFDIVKTVMGMLIYAEVYGVSSANVPFTVTGDSRVDRLLGTQGYFGQERLGLRRTAAQAVIRAVGNYGEIYERHLTPLGLVREGSRNALWLNAPCSDCPKGGQIYAPPMR